jgi:RHS repeat-associated protein
VLNDRVNVTSIINTSGTVQERYGYNAFGTSRVMNASFVVQSSSSYNWETRFAAYRWDSESGLYQVRYRYYHPLLGTWINRDPIGEDGGINLYIYINNTPTGFVDLFGLCRDPIEEMASCFHSSVDKLTAAGSRRNCGMLNNFYARARS